MGIYIICGMTDIGEVVGGHSWVFLTINFSKYLKGLAPCVYVKICLGPDFETIVTSLLPSFVVVYVSAACEFGRRVAKSLPKFSP